jgi:8-oxo-dGTP pyrophosphatase MutT (NUDIX family)
VDQEETIYRIKSILGTNSNQSSCCLESKLIKAAVLVPLISRKNSLNLLFTIRAKTLRRHAGEICFPGGKFDIDDDSLVTTALREAKEEIGLDSHHINLLGIASQYVSASGFIITPVVGNILEPLNLKLSESEISEVFELEIENFLDPSRFSFTIKTDRHRVRKSYQIQIGNRLIHGITAGIIYDIFSRLELS